MRLANRSILISGASIAGPTLGYWLTRYGFEVTIVERAPGIRPGGTPIDVRGPAAVIAERMGITPELRKADIATEGLAFIDATGAPLASLALHSPETRHREFELPRTRLAQILHEATADDIHYLFDDGITALHQDDDGVEVVFRHAPTRRFDLVVGADGTHSAVRRLVFGEDENFLRHLGYYAAVVSGVDPAFGRAHWGVAYNSPGKLVCVYSTPEQSDVLFLFRQKEPFRYDYHDQYAQKDFVLTAFAGESWSVPKLLEVLRNTDDIFFDSIGRVTLPHWTRGRITVVGDAAHGLPLFGDGSSQAMLGAYTLAGELATACGDHRAGFLAYENRHRPQLPTPRKAIRLARALLVPNTQAGIWRRNQLARMSHLIPDLSWMHRWSKHNNVHPTPEYHLA